MSCAVGLNNNATGLNLALSRDCERVVNFMQRASALSGLQPAEGKPVLQAQGLYTIFSRDPAASIDMLKRGLSREEIRAQGGGGKSSAAQHGNSLEAWLCHVPGLFVAMPSTPYDAKGLLKTAIRMDDPVFFIEHKMLYMTKGEVPDGDYTLPFGVADIKRKGEDVTIVATSRMVLYALEAAAELEKEGISAEVIDPRTLVPLDIETIEASVKKTGRCVIVHEAPKTSGFGGELSALVQERCFYHLEAPIARVTGWDTPYPHAFEWEYFPGPERVATALKAVMTGGR